MFSLIPYPCGSLTQSEARCLLPAVLSVSYGGFAPDCARAFCERLGKNASAASSDAAFLRLRRDAALPPEGYILDIAADGICVRASGESGVMQALTSVVWLLRERTDGALPCCHIEDGPKYRHRGMHLDCARHFFPIEEIYRIVETASLAKLNVLHWHLSDDQGWRIESRRFPQLQAVSGSFYTQEEIRTLCEFARLRGVEIVPEIDMPGHMRALLAALPQYSCFSQKVQPATSGGIYPVILCPGKEETFSFLEELLDEIVPLFPGPRFHIGGDEAPKGEWQKCPHCAARMKQLGLTRYDDLQGYFTGRVSETLQRRGKRAVCWNETLLAANPPQNIQIQYWTLQHRHSMARFAAAGGQWIYSDMFELYLDYPYSMTPLKKVYETVPHLGEENVAGCPGLLGMEACLWTEHVKDCRRLEELLFPRLFALAEICWSGARGYDDFQARLRKTLSAADRASSLPVAVTPAEHWNPSGEERRREAFAYLAAMNEGMSDEVRQQTVQSAAPGPEFARSFMTKFFAPEDLPLLMKATGQTPS